MRINPSHSTVSRTTNTQTNPLHTRYSKQPPWYRKPIDWLHTITDAVIPNHCALCNSRAKSLLCAPCAADIPDIQHSCTRCALPLPQSELCPECLQSPPSFDKVVAAYEYAYPLDHLVLQFKHNNHPHIGRQLAKKLSLTVQSENLQADTPDIIACVPLHWRKRLKRGFNQAEIIAKHCHSNAAGHAARYLPQLLSKTHHTQSQQNLSRKQRLKNLRQSFAVAPKLHSDIKGKHIAVVDDVITTGATAEVIANLLKQAGANRVDFWALARTPKLL